MPRVYRIGARFQPGRTRLTTILLLTSIILAMVMAGPAVGDDFSGSTPETHLPRLLSFVSISGTGSLQYGGSTEITLIAEDYYAEGSADNADLYGPSFGIGVTAGSFLNGDVGFFVGVRYTQLQLEDSVDVRTIDNEVVPVALAGEGLKLHDFELGIIVPLFDPRVSSLSPMLAGAVALSSPKSLFDQSGRVAHIRLSGGALIRLSPASLNGTGFSLYTSVMYDFGHEDDIPSMGSVGLALQFSWASRRI